MIAACTANATRGGQRSTPRPRPTSPPAPTTQTSCSTTSSPSPGWRRRRTCSKSAAVPGRRACPSPAAGSGSPPSSSEHISPTPPGPTSRHTPTSTWCTATSSDGTGPDEVPEESVAFEQSGWFDAVAVHRYVWAIDYDVDGYLALLETFSGHIAMEPAKRAHLYDEIRRRLATPPSGTVHRHWVAVMTIGRRL